jgi:flagellum-specific peptidoglycan hydrolase FlgJ
MLDKAEKVIADAKSIKSGSSSSKSSSGSGGSISGTKGKGNAAIKSVAEKVGKSLGVDPSVIYAQLAQESGSGSITSGKNNYGGMTYTGAKGSSKGSHQPDGSGYYANYDSLDDFSNSYMKTLKNMGVKSGMSISDYAKLLSQKHYYTGDESTYERNMQSLAKNYKATGGIYSLNRNTKLHATGGIYDTPTTTDGTNIYGEAGAEAAIPVNSAHKFSGEAALKNLAGVFGKQVIDAGSRGNTSSNFHLNPSYQVNIKAGAGMNEKEIAEQVNSQLQANQDDFMKKLNSFYAKAVAQ